MTSPDNSTSLVLGGIKEQKVVLDGQLTSTKINFSQQREGITRAVAYELHVFTGKKSSLGATGNIESAEGILCPTAALAIKGNRACGGIQSITAKGTNLHCLTEYHLETLSAEEGNNVVDQKNISRQRGRISVKAQGAMERSVVTIGPLEIGLKVEGITTIDHQEE